MAGKISVNQVQLGDSSTATNNFVWQTNVDGTCKLARGNVGATTQDILTVDAAGKVVFPQNTQSMVRLHAQNGFGSTNTCIRRFATVTTNTGSDITYTDSAANGGSFTINTSGVYSISYSDIFSIALAWMGVSLNSASLTTQINALSASELLTLTQTPDANAVGCVSWTGFISSGSVIRAHCQAGLSAGVAANPVFTITRVV